MSESSVEPDVLATLSGGHRVFVGVLRCAGVIVWRSDRFRSKRERAWEDAEAALARQHGEGEG